MEINVVNIIIDSLMANGKCSIEGLGTFILNKSAAIIDTQSNTYIAPSKTILFTDIVDSDYSLADELLKVYPFSEAKSKKIVTQFSNKVLNGLINFEKVELKNLGTIRSNKKGIEYEISETLQLILDASSPNVDLTPFAEAVKDTLVEDTPETKIAKTSTEATAANTFTNDATAKLEESKKYREQLVGGHDDVHVSPIMSTSEETVVPELKHTPSLPIAEKASSESNEKKEKVPVASSTIEKATPVEVNEGFWSIWLPWLLLLLLLGGLFWGVSKIVKLSKANQEIAAFEQVATEDTEDRKGADIAPETSTVNKEIVGDDTTDEDSGQGSSSNEPTSSGDNSDQISVGLTECIIITGVYRKQHNIDAMASDIKRAGYDVYTEPSSHYTRVGFTFNCKDSDLKEVIDEVRRTISPDAWYLVPDVEM